MARLPRIIQTILRQAGQTGDREKIPVYAVGGFVRDLLLGIENFDLDLVVEGDGINYASKNLHHTQEEIYGFIMLSARQN